MKVKILLLLGLGWAKGMYAQSCQTAAELDALPGKYIDAAHCEYPAMRASWLNDLKTQASITMASKVLTQIEGVERDSRKDFDLKGVVLKSTFSGRNPDFINGSRAIASYDLQLGCYEYICINKKMMTNSEYETVLRVYVNRFKDVEEAFDVSDARFFLTPGKYDGRFVRLHYFYRFRDKQLLTAMNGGIGFYQDVNDEKVKQGNRSTYITRHWYITKPGQPLFVPVTKDEYLQALQEYNERAKAGPGLKEESVDGLYKLNPVYFSGDAASPAKPKMIELSYRYTKVPAGQRLVENFTKNFDFKAIQKMLE